MFINPISEILLDERKICQLNYNFHLTLSLYHKNKKKPLILPLRDLVFHSSASSGQDLSFMASVKSMEYFLPVLLLVIIRVTAGPCDLTSTHL